MPRSSRRLVSTSRGCWQCLRSIGAACGTSSADRSASRHERTRRSAPRRRCRSLCAIEVWRDGRVSKKALNIGTLVSRPTLRQHLDARGATTFEPLPGMIERLFSGQRPDHGVLACGWLVPDANVFARDQGGKAKEGGGRTAAGTGGGFASAAWLGKHGLCMAAALRPNLQQLACVRRVTRRLWHGTGGPTFDTPQPECLAYAPEHLAQVAATTSGSFWHLQFVGHTKLAQAAIEVIDSGLSLAPICLFMRCRQDTASSGLDRRTTVKSQPSRLNAAAGAPRTVATAGFVGSSVTLAEPTMVSMVKRGRRFVAW